MISVHHHLVILNGSVSHVGVAETPWKNRRLRASTASRLADFVAVEAWQATLGLHIVEHGAKRLPEGAARIAAKVSHGKVEN